MTGGLCITGSLSENRRKMTVSANISLPVPAWQNKRESPCHSEYIFYDADSSEDFDRPGMIRLRELIRPETNCRSDNT